jgi:hypothetical protein
MVSEFAIGVVLCLIGAGATNLGLTIQKLSFTHNDLLPIILQKACLKQWSKYKK